MDQKKKPQELRIGLRLWLAVILVTSFLSYAASPVQAGSLIMVTTTADENGGNPDQCALREAIIAANTDASFGGCTAGSGTDTIFLSSEHYRLTIGGVDEVGRIGDLDITTSIYLAGMGPGITYVHGDDTDRVFDVRSTAGVSIANLTITGGKSIEGGGVRVLQSSADFYNVFVDNNQAEKFGGGFVITSGSTVSISNSEITANTSDRAGAIISDGVLTLNNSLIFGNSSAGVKETALGVVEINSKTSTTLNRIENTTIAGNSAPSAGLVAGVRVSSTANVLIRNATIVNNSGSGLAVQAGGELNLSHSIIAQQQGGAQNCAIGLGGYTSLGHNLDNDGSCNLNAVGDKSNINIDIGLADAPDYNGGKTRNYALTQESPAIDAGSPVLDAANPSACQPVDQRYYFRPGDGNLNGEAICDIGAFELEGTRPNSYTFLPAILR